jgi:hypothetical protein
MNDMLPNGDVNREVNAMPEPITAVDEDELLCQLKQN